jgi:deoxyribodipyrimidine photo-lyase
MHKSQRLIVWFRNDLRVHDNRCLQYAAQYAKHNNVQIVPIYVFDPDFTTKKVSQYGIQKCSENRMRFTIEAV